MYSSRISLTVSVHVLYSHVLYLCKCRGDTVSSRDCVMLVTCSIKKNYRMHKFHSCNLLTIFFDLTHSGNSKKK